MPIGEEGRARLKERSKAILVLEGLGVLVWICSILSVWNRYSANTLILPPPSSASATEIFVSFLIGGLLLYWSIHYKQLGRVVSWMLGLSIFLGGAITVGWKLSAVVALGLVLFERYSRSFISNNLLVLVGSLFLSLDFASRYPLPALFVTASVLCVYDVIAVLFSTFMVRLARTAVFQQSPLMLLAPVPGESWFSDTHQHRAVAVLGAGDVIVPAVLLAGIASQSSAAIVSLSFAGACAGAIANLTASKKLPNGVPALPLIVIGIFCGFFLGK